MVMSFYTTCFNESNLYYYGIPKQGSSLDFVESPLFELQDSGCYTRNKTQFLP